MADIKLTDAERMILANQYDILAVLRSDGDYERMAENLRNGHEWLYSQYFDYISENLSEEKAEHVIAILALYEDLRFSYDHLSDKSGIDEESVFFPGFDGNNESDLLSFARGLIKADRFIEVLGEKAKNSHTRTTETYKRMLSHWRALGEPKCPFSKEITQEILAA